MQALDNSGLSLEEARRRFEQWRRRNSFGRIPHELWQLAAETASTHGVELTAAGLELDPQRLNQWVEKLGKNGKAVEAEAVPFVELPPLNFGPAAECTLELEEPSGRKLRIVLRGPATRQAVELGEMLRRSSP